MNINFSTEVLKRFRYLEQEYGFALVENDRKKSWEECVNFLSSSVRIEIYCESDPFTVGLRFSDSLAPDSKVFEFHTYLKLVDRELARKFGYSVPKDDEEILELLDMYSEALRTRGESILKGDAKTFARFREALKTGKGLETLENVTRFTLSGNK
jgi:hypothetical protein